MLSEWTITRVILSTTMDGVVLCTRMIGTAYRGVTSERLDTNNPLRSSKYRVIGKVLTDDMVKKWLKRAFSLMHL